MAFIAWPGAATDGRAYVKFLLWRKVLSACAWLKHRVVTAWSAAWQSNTGHKQLVAAYAGLKADTGWIADAYYEQPSQALKVVAVTGTNGKTSSTWWLAQALNANSQAMTISGSALCNCWHFGCG